MDEQGPVGTSVAAAIAALSRQLVDDDFLGGPLEEILYDHIDLPSEVVPFIKGVRLGAGYAISMILTGKLDLTLLEIDPNQGSLASQNFTEGRDAPAFPIQSKIANRK